MGRFNTSVPASTVFGTSFPVAATASSGLSAAVTTTGGCSIAGGAVTMTSGTIACVVRFNQAGDASYGPAPEVVQNVTAQKAGQTIAFAPLPARTLTESPIEVSATASSGLAVSFTTTTAARCTSGGPNGATITLVGTGACTVRASQAGNADYHPAPAATQSFTLGKGDQTISITTAPPASAVFGSSFPVAATASSGLPVAITPSGGCALADGAVRMTSGTTACVVRFNQSGNATYKAAPQVVTNITAQTATQTITVTTPPPASAVYRRAFSVAATASSGLGVLVTTSGGCSGSSGAVTMTSGTTACVIRFTQPGNGNYAAALETIANVAAEKASQTIAFAALPNRQRSQSPFAVSASATSSLAMTFTTTTPTVCTSSGTNGRTIALVAAGTCTGQADQAGNANYNAATPVARSFTVQ